jgi:hypothetical protein
LPFPKKLTCNWLQSWCTVAPAEFDTHSLKRRLRVNKVLAGVQENSWSNNQALGAEKAFDVNLVHFNGYLAVDTLRSFTVSGSA